MWGKSESEQSNSDSKDFSRRGALATISGLGVAALSATTVEARDGGGSRPTSTAEISVVENPNFITNATGERLPKDDELVFDTGPVSIPLDRLVAVDDGYDNVLFESLNDSRQLVVKPPEGYDRESDYDASWPPLRWSDIADTTGEITVDQVTNAAGPSGDAGTQVDIAVEDAIPNGQYTVWVVKFAALKDPDEFGNNPFVTPAGNGLVGFHNLGQKFDADSRAENQFTTDAEGNGSISVVSEGGELSGVPGFGPLEGEDIDDPVEDGPVPFVGEPDDYEQSDDDPIRIDNDLREEDEIHFVGAYHYDDQVWGVYPGPWHVNHFSAVFRF